MKAHLDIAAIETIPQSLINSMVEQALEEDIGNADITGELIPERNQASARVVTREPMVLCGRDWVDQVFHRIDSQITLQWFYEDGSLLNTDTVLLELNGPARSLLKGERTALNFLQMLSGTATLTYQYVQAVAHTGARILDTRKTIPLYRLAQKYAVYCGGGTNHRIGLFDAFLIKENHIAAAGGIEAAVATARACYPQKLIEVEVENTRELELALKAGAEVIMLDNFSLAQMREAVAASRGRAQLEASGNVSFARLSAIAETGVDFISVGGLTKHMQAIDLSMRLQQQPL